jgi:membrane protease YdiL (CAAX protease family)
VAVARLVGAAVQLAYPLLTAVTGAVATLRPGWPWLLIGTFAFHGLAEELVWRGYAYRRLRQGRSFANAVLWTMPLVAALHVPILVTSGFAVGLAALTVAAVTAVPLARLFDAGRGTLWAPAIVHTAIDSFKLVVVPAAALTAFSLLLAALSVVLPLLVVLPRVLGASGVGVDRVEDAGVAPRSSRTRPAVPGLSSGATSTAAVSWRVPSPRGRSGRPRRRLSRCRG